MDVWRRLSSSRLRGLSSALARQSDVVVAYLFGSTARGEAGPLSDVDIAVLLREGDGSATPARRRLQLSRLAAEALDEDGVDVVLLSRADPDLAFRVVRDGVVLACDDERARLAFEVSAIDRYLDLQPFRRAQDAALAERLLDGRYGRPASHP